MQLLKIINANDRQYPFYHCNEDDARYLHDDEGKLLLIIDANLNIKTEAGYFGSIECESNWVLYYGPIRTRFDTEVSVDTQYRKSCWGQLEKAEVKVCEFFLGRGNVEG